MSQRPPHRIQGFDGIRAIAVFGVFLMHKTAWGERYQLGQYGVWLFFLLSGFLITAQLAKARERVENASETTVAELSGFWWRRSFRILPPYYALLTLMAALYAVRARQVPGLPWHFSYATNWFIEFRTPTGDIGTWGHFWSLAIEEQFYLLFAPLVILSPRRWAPVWCSLFVIAGLAWRIIMVQSGWPSFAIYVDTLANFASLALGGLAGLFVQRKPLKSPQIGWGALLLLGLLPFVLRSVGFIEGLRPLVVLPVGLALILSIHGAQHSLLTRILGFGPIAYFGRISYGFYLYESYPPAGLGAGLFHLSGGMAQVFGGIIAFALSFLISAVSYELFEMPIQRWGRKLQIGQRTPEPA